MIQAVRPQVLASVGRGEDPRQSQLGFRPEKEIPRDRRPAPRLREAAHRQRVPPPGRPGAGPQRPVLQDPGDAFDLLNAENGVILLFDPNTQQLTPAPIKRRAEEEVMVSQTLLEQVVKTHEGVLTQDAIVDARFSAAQSIVAQGIRSAMAVPLLSKGELRGVLYLDTRKRAGSFQEKDLRILAGVRPDAVAIEKRRVARRIEHGGRDAPTSRASCRRARRAPRTGSWCSPRAASSSRSPAVRRHPRLHHLTERSSRRRSSVLNEYFELGDGGVRQRGRCSTRYRGQHHGPVGRPGGPPDDAAGHQAACGMIVRQGVQRERGRRGKSRCPCGIGVNTAWRSSANMGSSKRLEYTASGSGEPGRPRCDVAREDQIVSAP
jgi:adenylate cyclase